MSKIENPSGIPEDDFLREGLVDRLTQYLEAEPGAWHVRYNLGVALMQQGDVDEALAQFRQVMAESPKHMESMVNVAAIHLGKGQPEEALRVLSAALKVWDIPMVRANLGVAYLQMERLEEAAYHLKEALNGAPNMPDALTNLSTVFFAHRGDGQGREGRQPGPGAQRKLRHGPQQPGGDPQRKGRYRQGPLPRGAGSGAGI